MAHTIEVAKTGRARCRTCRQTIEKGALRFGEEQPSAFGEGNQWVWQHLACAAKKKPGPVREAMAAFEGEIPDRAGLEAALAEADQNATAFPHAERAPTGRSKCQHCSEPIEKGALRVAFERELDMGGAPRIGAGYLHAACAAEYLEDADLMATLLKNSRGLDEADLAELHEQVGA
jgi:poly [ADP-ribose] polymerase